MKPPSNPASGILLVDKPAGLTSHDVVARTRKLAGTRKIGHAGTLDPMATGLLVLGMNSSTRLLTYVVGLGKEYSATIRLGQSSDTDDAEGTLGEPVDTSAVTDERIAAGIAELSGEISQVPSSFSAIKVDGKRAYALARAGEEVELKSRTVTISAFEILETRRGASADGFVDVDVRVECSSGTYIRALARDLGNGLGVGGHLTALRRTAVGPYGLDVAHTLDELAETFTLLPIADAARAAFPARDLDDETAAAVRVGRALDVHLDGLTALFAPDGTFLALYAPREGRARPVAVFV
jgi:tRNA pseudouridine55 synthase